MTLCWSLLAAVAPFAATPVRAGEFNEVLKIGDPAPAWEALPGIDGQRHSLADLAESRVVVVAFTCASCPTARDYESRINSLANRFRESPDQVAVIAVSVNRVEEDQLPALTARAQERNLQFLYLYDESQKIARDFGAIVTPQFFVLDKERQVVYMGAMDDATDPAAATRNYVEEAIAAALADKHPEVTEMMPRGCRIRYVVERRR